MVHDLAFLPTTRAGIARLAVARLVSAGVPAAPLLKAAGLTDEVLVGHDQRVLARHQVALLDRAATALADDRLGFTLAQDFDPRTLGLLFYVMASSQKLGDALQRIARYSAITNEALVFSVAERGALALRLRYVGLPRHFDRHQAEFCIFGAIRLCRILTGTTLVPLRVSIAHHRSGDISAMSRFAGTTVEFGANADELVLPAEVRERPLVNADPYLNDLMLEYCETALSSRTTNASPLRVSVENAIAPLLPHGKVRVEVIARLLGMSERTLARKLADEGLSFSEILQQLRRDLAVRYLNDGGHHVSKVAWLLGFQEVSAFSHAFKEWTGVAPSQMRLAAAHT
ncbi:AraC family transcriptional regulator [Bosea sp. NBC_00550]|uniref:AraC family transcriptional regulator n=1 Tax=Bosea sp. NBC_00550 TaxID=2969621 RepID=UPI00222F0F7B|nr:AraC family transcriptional regulator [Bosea sp. NBC_00550]UZF93023.1 AraC family transcriptional regulator [Bosea sp. NBC_00550]